MHFLSPAVRGLDQVGRVVKQPPFWLLAAGGLALAGGANGRRAAARGSVCYLPPPVWPTSP